MRTTKPPVRGCDVYLPRQDEKAEPGPLRCRGALYGLRLRCARDSSLHISKINSARINRVGGEPEAEGGTACSATASTGATTAIAPNASGSSTATCPEGRPVLVGQGRHAETCDEAKGLERLNQNAASGLTDCQQNADQIAAYLEQHKLTVTVASVDQAVAALKSSLHWNGREKSQPQQPPPPPQPEVPDLLPNGEPRLPLGTIPSSRHSITQLRDLDARERAAKGRGGWHGANF
jgi:hypothetical protein